MLDVNHPHHRHRAVEHVIYLNQLLIWNKDLLATAILGRT